MTDFETANQIVHPVETQWHYKYLTKYGFKPLDKQGIGFVRRYRYQKGQHTITCTTGANADYWADGIAGGYWADLEPHLQKLYANEPCTSECSQELCTECACTHEA